MKEICGAEHIYAEIASLMEELYEHKRLAKGNTARLRKALNEYWMIECDHDCRTPFCKFKKPIDWIEYMGYTSLADLLKKFEYESRIKPIKQGASGDPLSARRSGHYNP